jgi:hypothetical protein
VIPILVNVPRLEMYRSVHSSNTSQRPIIRAMYGMVNITPSVSITAQSPIVNPKKITNTPTNIGIMRGVETLYFALHSEHLKRNGVGCLSPIKNVISVLQFLHFIIIHRTSYCNVFCSIPDGKHLVNQLTATSDYPFPNRVTGEDGTECGSSRNPGRSRRRSGG